MEVVRHRGSVVLVPMPDPARIVLVRQYRYAVGRCLLELPAGGIEPGELPDAAAKRECEEEIGRQAELVKCLGTLYPTPGFCDEAMTFFLLSGLKVSETPAVRDPDEFLDPVVVTIDDLRRRIATGEVVDMKTIAGLALLDHAPPND